MNSSNEGEEVTVVIKNGWASSIWMSTTYLSDPVLITFRLAEIFYGANDGKNMLILLSLIANLEGGRDLGNLYQSLRRRARQNTD